jgi:histidinol phosphatase-like enzyme (inositol monophosphatase family)
MDDRAFADRCIALTHRLADVCGAIALKYFRKGIIVDAKTDATPVTLADREGEEAMRALIRREFPSHGIIGEEHGRENDDAEWLWILDPIDGTASFINGVPLFGTLIGLWQRTSGDHASAALGCINHPVLTERWIGGQSTPTTYNGRPVRSRACATLAEATVYLTDGGHFRGDENERFARLAHAAKRTRVGGTDCYHYAMVASGWTDIACEAGLKLHDYAAVVPVLEGAGAVITDWNGAPLALQSERTVNGQVLAAGDKDIHAEAVRLLSSQI